MDLGRKRNFDAVIGDKHLETSFGSDDELRIVLIGKTGYGKSATGNTIIGGEPVFEEDVSASSVTSECEVANVERFGTKMRIIDTPGLFDTTLSKQEIQRELSRCMLMSSPGPHIFLLVLRVGKFTEEDENAVTELQEMFGEAAEKHTLIVFTGKDNLLRMNKSIDDYLSQGNSYLTRLTDQIPFVTFDNTVQDEDQVIELIDAIKTRLEPTGLNSNHYTNNDFRQANEALNIRKQKHDEQERKRTDNYLQGFKKRNSKLAETIKTERKHINHLNREHERSNNQCKRQMVENKKQKEYMANELKRSMKKRKVEVDQLEHQNKEELEQLLFEVNTQRTANERHQQIMNAEIDDVKTQYSDGIKNIYDNNEKRLKDFTESMKEKYPGKIVRSNVSIGYSPTFDISFQDTTRQFYLTRNGESSTDSIPGYDGNHKVTQQYRGDDTYKLEVKDDRLTECHILDVYHCTNW